MKRLIAFAILLLAPLSALQADDLTPWKEDFSDGVAFKKNWSGGDSLLPGGDNTQRFWQIEDGVMRGRAWRIHPMGIMRKVSGTDLRLTCRIKLGEGTRIALNYNGPNNGSIRTDRPDVNFRRAGVHIGATQVSFFDDYYTHPDAEALKNADVKTSASNMKAVKLAVPVNVWHDLKLEMRGKELIASIDGSQVLSYTTHSGDEPKMSVSLSVINESKNETSEGWIDDIAVEPIEQAKE